MPCSTLQFDSCLGILPLIRHCRGGEPNNSCCKGISYVLQREKCQSTCRRLNDISHPS
ncbi:unnamed protein product [Spirodela intermedia]|uniref:Uncharacterized protein n=1 Tax=Spirodela intermedia TaxID=51605 RepID=A0A7I8J767_SPIIN|nr:unnamed protein product [Spirodela intermedia]CAA6666076.1 unnamed protein product [Spirodela intermedia]